MDTSLPNKQTVGARQAQTRSDPHRSWVQPPGFAEAQRVQVWTHGNRHKPPGFRFGVNIKSHQGLISRSFFYKFLFFFFFFFKQALKEKLLFLLYLEVLPSLQTFSDSRP